MDRRKGKVLLHCLMVLMVIHVKRASFRERGVCVCFNYYCRATCCLPSCVERGDARKEVARARQLAAQAHSLTEQP